MAARASITVNDRATTPAAHIFVPRGNIGDEVAVFVESNGGVAIGERKITIQAKPSFDGKSKSRHRIRLINPTLVTETVNGVNVPTVPRTNFVDVTFTFDVGSNQQERKDTVGMFYNLLGTTQAMVLASLVDGEKIY